jgi:hypothetical protein
MITLFHAIQSLVPGAEVSVGMYDKTIIWHKPETAPVTTAQILEEQRRLQQAYDWSEYQRNRAREYPAVEEQLDALYHAGVFPPEMAARIRAVKAKYPRPPINQQQWIEQMPVAAVVTPEVTPAVTSAPAPVSYPTLTPKMTVEEWLTQEAKMTHKQWLEKQKNQTQPRQMTREEWLAEQLNLGN